MKVTAYLALCCLTGEPIISWDRGLSGLVIKSPSIRIMRIFMWVRWRGASNESGVVENDDFHFFHPLYIPNFHIQGHNYYTVIYSDLAAVQ